MKPSVPALLDALGALVQREVAPALGEGYLSQQMLRSVGLLKAAAEEFDRAAARRVTENTALRALFDRSVDAVDDPALADALREGQADARVSTELQSVLRDELPELVHAYLKVPAALQQRATHGGSSPEQQLRAGLVTLEGQLHALHEQLAAEDLRKLAVHQRYLDLKYNPPGSAGP